MMISQKILIDRGFLILLTTVFALLLVACGSGENSSAESGVSSDSPSKSRAASSKPKAKNRIASLVLGEKTISFRVEICSNAGGGTFTLSGSVIQPDGTPVNIMVRGISGQSQVFIKFGERNTPDAREWRGGTKTTNASIEDNMLTASGTAVALDLSTGTFTEETKTFSVDGPCPDLMDL